MKMNDTVARIVEIMFQDVEQNEETQAIRDEVMNNCQERFNDMVASGISEDDAIAAVVESLKGMDDVLAPYKRKVQHTREENEDGESVEEGEQHVIFAVKLVRWIDAALFSEDVNIEASDDEDYHVIWDNEGDHRLKVELNDDTLHITRIPGENVRAKRESRTECNANFQMEELSGFVKSEDGKIEIDMSGIGRSMKSLGEKIKLMFADSRINIRSIEGKVTIQVPENAIPHVKLMTTSGDIHVEDVGLTDLSVTSTSGDINVSLDEEKHIERIDMHTTSGDMEVSAFADRMDITSTSGDVEVEGRVNDLTVNTISGDIDVRADVVYMHFKAISGDVDMAFESDEIREVRGSTISGDIDIDLPEGIGTMAIQTQTRSGDATTRCHTNGVGPTVNGNVSSMSGDITIR